MAKIQWLTNPNSGNQIPAPRGGAWIWDGCIWKHTCCPPAVCDYEGNGGINMVFNLSETGDPGTGFKIYIWIKYNGLLNGEPSFISNINGTDFSLQYNGSQWILEFDFLGSGASIATSSSINGPWNVSASPFIGINFIETICGPYRPKCIQIEDSVNGYTESGTWIPVSLLFPEIGTIWSYLNISGQTAISGGDFFSLIKFSDIWALSYQFYYISPQPESFSFTIGAGSGTEGNELPDGTYTYTGNGNNITFTISTDANYSCPLSSP